MSPDQINARSWKIRMAWYCRPELREAMSARKRKPGSKRSSREAYNAYYREYRRKKKNAYPVCAPAIVEHERVMVVMNAKRGA